MLPVKTKNRDAQKKWSSNKVRGVSPEAGREFMVGMKKGYGRLTAILMQRSIYTYSRFVNNQITAELMGTDRH